MKEWKKIGCSIFLALLLGLLTPSMGIESMGVPLVAQAAKISLSKTSLSLKKGKTYTLKLKNAKKVTWKSNNSSIASINKNGKVTAKKAGTTKVYASYKGTRYYCKVTVKKENAQKAVKKELTDKELRQTVDGRITLAKRAVKEIIAEENFDVLSSDVEIVKQVHDYLVLNCEYDEVNFDKWLAGDIEDVPETDHEAYGALVKKIAVCDGYASAFQIFMDELGVEGEYVEGYATDSSGEIGHAWNIVTLDGENYHIDVTWDDPVPDQKDSVQYSYFLLDDETMSLDHRWANSVVDCDGTKYRLYPYEVQGIVANTLEETYALVLQQYNAGTPEKFDLELLVPDSISEEQIISYLGEIWIKDGKRSYWHTAPVVVQNYRYYHIWTDASVNAE